jgi:hypothetical protein
VPALATKGVLLTRHEKERPRMWSIRSKATSSDARDGEVTDTNDVVPITFSDHGIQLRSQPVVSLSCWLHIGVTIARPDDDPLLLRIHVEYLLGAPRPTLPVALLCTPRSTTRL